MLQRQRGAERIWSSREFAGLPPRRRPSSCSRRRSRLRSTACPPTSRRASRSPPSMPRSPTPSRSARHTARARHLSQLPRGAGQSRRRHPHRRLPRRGHHAARRQRRRAQTLDARKATFAPMDAAVVETGMQYGGITPLGIPSEWRLLLDARVAALPRAIVGAGSVAQSCSCRRGTRIPSLGRGRRRTRQTGCVSGGAAPRQSPSDARRRRVTSAAGMRRGKAATMRSSPAASSPSGCTP